MALLIPCDVYAPLSRDPLALLAARWPERRPPRVRPAAAVLAATTRASAAEAAVAAETADGGSRCWHGVWLRAATGVAARLWLALAPALGLVQMNADAGAAGEGTCWSGRYRARGAAAEPSAESNAPGAVGADRGERSVSEHAAPGGMRDELPAAELRRVAKPRRRGARGSAATSRLAGARGPYVALVYVAVIAGVLQLEAWFREKGSI